MTIQSIRLGIAAGSAALLVGVSPVGPAWAQTVSGGTSGGVSGPGVSASTYGSGTLSNSADSTAMGVEGGGAATAEGGTATTDSTAKLNAHRAMQRSTSRASDDDERARSRTMTVVTPAGVRSRTSSMYKEQGQKPVRESTTVRVAPDGTTTTK